MFSENNSMYLIQLRQHLLLTYKESSSWIREEMVELESSKPGTENEVAEALDLLFVLGINNLSECGQKLVIIKHNLRLTFGKELGSKLFLSIIGELKKVDVSQDVDKARKFLDEFKNYKNSLEK